MTQTHSLQTVTRLPLPGDNVAIATRKLDAGTIITTDDGQFSLDFTVLEGHRFAIRPIAVGKALLSWELPFGLATKAIAPGNYVCNAGMLAALAGRSIDFALPAEANFEDRVEPYILDEANFQPAASLPRHESMRTFQGYRRSPARGVGTRNTIILLGTSSRTGGYVKQLEAQLKGLADEYENIDSIVAVAHTEGDVEQPNNLDLVLRTLAGFMVHSNVGAVLAVDYGGEPINNQLLQTYLQQNGYPLDDVVHHFLSLSSSFEENLMQGKAIVEDWLAEVNATPRTPQSLSELKLALQCGGSDAFSGVSGNPLASWVARELIRYGGAANLAETDELIGAEPYVLQKVSNIEAARNFLMMVERFKAYAERHGSSAEGNPSGGNKFRGLYNIVLKSIGAAMKRHPDVPLDFAIEYSQPMLQPGYYFMDSPGNDLESIAGQVAAGSNMIYFVTGNGSITNFPFVPTIKIVTTSQRFELLSKDMDVNAGAYLDGTPMDDLGAQTLDLTVDVASGQRSVGEKAGHAQVQLWRNWPQNAETVVETPTLEPTGTGVPIQTDGAVSDFQFQAIQTPHGPVTDQVGLILPTSLCSGQIARMAAERFNQQGLGKDKGLSRFVALVHTEGCGASSGVSEELYVRTLLGYLQHPLVKYCVLLEHGCEKTHNDYMSHEMARLGLDPAKFGWASVQLDGGIERAIAKMEAWFKTALAEAATPVEESAGLDGLRIGLVNAGPVSAEAAQGLARTVQVLVSGGATVVVPAHADVLATDAFTTLLGGQTNPSFIYASQPQTPGLHIMETQSRHWVETLSGLGATGVELILAYIGAYPMPSHPMVPVLQLTADEGVQTRYGADLDLVLDGDSAGWPDQILQLLVETASRRHKPKLYAQGNIDFQITRGLMGISL